MCTGLEIAAIASVAIAAAGTATSIAGQQQQAHAAKAQAAYQSQVAQNNATIAQQKAADARRRGEIAFEQQKTKTRVALGAYNAYSAGRGVEVGSGSQALTQGDIAAAGTLDALQVRNNAEREALGFTAQADQFTSDAGLYTLQGQNEAQSANIKSIGTGLSGLGSVADKWYSFKSQGLFK